MNKRTNSNLSGRLVPIFANSKKKRLKQALYANPTTDDFEDLSTVTSTNSYNGFSSGADYFEANKTALQKQSFPRPQRLNSPNNEGYDSNSLSATRQSQYATRGRGGITNPPSSRGSHTAKNRGGLQSWTPVKQEPQRFENTGDVLSRADTTIKNNNNRARGSQYQPGRGVTHSGVKKEQDKTGKSRPYGANSNLPIHSESFQQAQSRSKDRSTKQVNLMASPTDKSLKVMTATIQDVVQWRHFEDKVSVIYEIFGTLDSQVSLNQAGNGKNFVIKDKTGNLRCIFWEMDRQLPRLTRGQIHRCVGCLDRKSGHFNCVSIRPVKQTELQVMAVFLEASHLVMQEQLATLKED